MIYIYIIFIQYVIKSHYAVVCFSSFEVFAAYVLGNSSSSSGCRCVFSQGQRCGTTFRGDLRSMWWFFGGQHVWLIHDKGRICFV